MKKNKFLKVLFIIAMVALAMLSFGWVVMSLWNAILPAVLGVKTISFMQALGILLLCKILFGGFAGKGGGGCGRSHWKQRMKEKWGNMTAEEREKFKAEWKNRCGMPWQQRQQDDAATNNPM
ncbi:MAG: hypothetical protein RL172_179 [Bacteroidota bacterium]|jgi:Ca2+/H+ antiporter, TMEM165/GDT1 family